ncbi:MAG: outer spore coat protein CotE [Bacilli bacterium]|nr:outer spore coat protein CotE [Bacilli bacterium]
MFKEIVTKAVIGKAKKTSSGDYTLVPEETPDTVLGCWVINHAFNGTNNNGSVIINGAFDVNVWYSYDNDTKTAVSTKRFNYDDMMNITLKNNVTLNDKSEIIVRSLKQPTVTNVSSNNGVVNLTIEKELGVEIIGDTKLKVSVEEDEDEYEIIVDDKQVSESIDEVDEDYLNE